MSRLDRFLVSGEWLDVYLRACQLALLKPTLDHCPILLDSDSERWGPLTFMFELMWLEEEDFPILIKEGWKTLRWKGGLVSNLQESINY